MNNNGYNIHVDEETPEVITNIGIGLQKSNDFELKRLDSPTRVIPSSKIFVKTKVGNQPGYRYSLCGISLIVRVFLVTSTN